MKKKNLPAVKKSSEISKDLEKQYIEDAKENLKNVHDAFYRISIKGSRYSVNGELIGDKGTEFTGIILKEIPVNLYYEEVYNPEDSTSSPLCWSLGGLKPDPSSSAIQSTSCIDCKLNRFGTQIGQDGKKRKGKACTNTRRLILAISGVDMPVLMSLPPTSIKAFNNYLKNLSIEKTPIPIFAVETIFEFDSSVQYPKPIMRKGNILSMDQYQKIKKYKESQVVINTLNAYASSDDYEKENKE